jgi:hypothetical protein
MRKFKFPDLKNLNLRFGLPLFLLISHQHISNSSIGLNNSFIGICLFLMFLFSMCFFLINKFKITYLNSIAIFLLITFVGLWLFIPSYFKEIANIYISLFCAYYIVSIDSLKNISNQLKFLVIISLLLSVIQISGSTDFVHLWNSQFITLRGDEFYRNIELENILNYNVLYNNSFDSRQVRPNGIFHSSAILSGIYTIYIAYVFLGYFKSKSSLALVPFLIIFSGSKLVLLSSIIMFLISFFFNKISFKRIVILIISSVICFSLHSWLFYSLLNFQFNLDILLYSINIRLTQFDFKVTSLEYFLPFLFYAFILFISSYFILKIFRFSHVKQNFFHFSIIIIALVSSFISTPHSANILFGWFFIPCFFWLKHTK